MRDPQGMDFAVAEAEAFLRSVAGSTVQVGYLPGVDRYEVTLFDHALDLWHVQHPGHPAPVGGAPTTRAEEPTNAR